MNKELCVEQLKILGEYLEYTNAPYTYRNAWIVLSIEVKS